MNITTQTLPAAPAHLWRNALVSGPAASAASLLALAAAYAAFAQGLAAGALAVHRRG
ncbi:hypothetical protein GCM10027277_11790 [Pseudoduganella ginsengisoli]|uniref:Uncharacterized protein n=1 Tax=Pseudoduganella ginsengisoli TaxID=1462440 RepID=A0A6L6PWP0_9BURK|nr:hypothetical protein [Pseudoduganella ginsengisoli]MTW01574.1 hypothetical protein [Pseudoduganella ginsengisoli]